MFGSTWAGRLRPSLLAHCEWSFCFRYSVRALGLWQYGWYVVDKGVGDIPGVRGGSGGVQRLCTIELDCHKNSDLGSESNMVQVLNTTTHCWIESVVLLTKEMRILTPLVLGIVVCVARRLILYKRNQNELLDRIVQSESTRLYCTKQLHEIVSYMGFRVREKEKVTRQSNVSA